MSIGLFKRIRYNITSLSRVYAIFRLFTESMGVSIRSLDLSYQVSVVQMRFKVHL